MTLREKVHLSGGGQKQPVKQTGYKEVETVNKDCFSHKLAVMGREERVCGPFKKNFFFALKRKA